MLRPLRRSIHRRGKTGRPAADHDEVDVFAFADGQRETQPGGNLAGRGIPNHLVADHHGRGVGGADVECAGERETGDGLVVNPLVRQLKSQKVGLQSKPGRRPGRAKDLDAACGRPVTDEVASRSKRAKQQIGEFGVFGHQLPKTVGGDAMDAAGFAGACREVDRLPGEEAEFADESPGAVTPDPFLRSVLRCLAHHLDLAGIDEYQVVASVAGAKVDVSRGDVFCHAVAAHPFELCIAQLRAAGNHAGRG